jgi:hypothetical protein
MRIQKMEKIFICVSKTKIIDGWMSMGHWWNDTGRGIPKYWANPLPQCLFFAHYENHV